MIHFPSLSTSHTPRLCSVHRRWYNYSFFIDTLIFAFIPNPLLLTQPSALNMLSTPHPFGVPRRFHILQQLPIATHLKQSSSNVSQFSIICIQPQFPYLKHLITLTKSLFITPHNFSFRNSWHFLSNFSPFSRLF